MSEGVRHHKEDMQDAQIQRLADAVNEIKLTVGLINLKMDEVASRPPPGLPIWAVMVFAVPQTLIACCLLAIALAAWLRGGF